MTFLCDRTADIVFQKFKDRQIKKFNKLREGIIGSTPTDINLRPSWLVNLSRKELTEPEKAVLLKSPKFAITPKIQPIDIAAPIEAALQYSVAPPQEVEMVRIRICEAIKQAKPPRRNLTPAEWRAARELRKGDTVCILQSDKGNATVILDTEEYDTKVLDLLNDRQSYNILQKDPT